MGSGEKNIRCILFMDFELSRLYTGYSFLPVERVKLPKPWITKLNLRTWQCLIYGFYIFTLLQKLPHLNLIFLFFRRVLTYPASSVFQFLQDGGDLMVFLLFHNYVHMAPAILKTKMSENENKLHLNELLKRQFNFIKFIRFLKVSNYNVITHIISISGKKNEKKKMITLLLLRTN